MVLTENRKARAIEGTKPKDEVSPLELARRSVVSHRPPASELKTPFAAVTAALTLRAELVSQMRRIALHPTAHDCAVSIGYVSPDLTVIGFTPLIPCPLSGSEQAEIMAMLTGNIPFGMVFGVAHDEEIVMGSRPFFTTSQTEAWLSNLVVLIRDNFAEWREKSR
jgi:hypothetical protein